MRTHSIKLPSPAGLTMTTKNVTLVLSGGGARGIAHIGVIEEFERRGYTINSIAGTSMGALVGGIYAMGKLREFKEWLYTLDKREIIRLLDFAFSFQGLIKGDRILNILKKFVSDAKIEDLEIEYTATAYDLVHEREVVLSTGNLHDAIRASISIPTVFTPVMAGKSILVDGGVVNNIPIKNAIRTENDLLVAVNVNAETPVDNSNITIQDKNRRRSVNYLDLVDNTIASAANQLAQLTIERYPPEILIEISRKSARTFEFLKSRELIEIGRLAAKKKLDSIRERETPFYSLSNSNQRTTLEGFSQDKSAFTVPADFSTNTSEMATFFQRVS